MVLGGPIRPWWVVEEAKKTEQPIQERLSVLPFGKYEDGRVGLAVPGLIADPWNAGERVASTPLPAINDDEGWANKSADAFSAAGLAATGALGLTAAGAGVPKGAVGIFGGRLAKTADQNALMRAEKLAAEGAPREQIWNDTGWFQGVDGKWRFEIDDSQATLQRSLAEIGDTGQSVPLGDFYRHDDLFAAYPELANSRFAATSRYRPGEGSVAEFTPEGATSPQDIILAGFKASSPTDSDLGAIKLLPHELEHTIQAIEGWATGGSPYAPLPKDIRGQLIDEKMRVMEPIAAAQGIPTAAMRKVVAKEVDGDAGRFEAYRRLAGEADARLPPKRLELSADERLARPPWLDYDVPEADQIVRFGGGVSANNPTGSSVPLAMNALERQPQGIRAYHGTRANVDGPLMPSEWGNTGPGLYVGLGEAGLPIAETFAGKQTFGYRSKGAPYDSGSILPLNTNAKLAPYSEYEAAWNTAAREKGSQTPVEDAQAFLRSMGYDGVQEGDQAVIFNPGTVYSATTGDLLYSGAPTGAAIPLTGETGELDEFDPLNWYPIRPLP